MAPVRAASPPRRSRWLLALALFVLPTLGLFGGVQLLRWHAMGEAERAALQRMQPEPLAGENGYGWLLMSSYEIAPEAVPGAMQTELEDFGRWHAGQLRLRALKKNQTPRAFVLRVATAHQARPTLKLDEASPLCRPLAPGCLARVSERREAVAELVRRDAPRLVMLERALAADHLDEPALSGFPKPQFQSLALLPTRVALDAVEGRPGLAIERGCRLLANTRRLQSRSRGLITNAILRAHAAGAAGLLLDIRRAHPGVALPDECAAALAPMQAAEFELCPAMRTEFAIESDARRQIAARAAPRGLVMAGIKGYFIENDALEAAWLARVFAAYCDDPAAAAFHAGQWLPPQPAPGPVARDSLACYAAFGPCARSTRAPPSFSNATGHTIELAARLRLLLAAHAVADGGPRVPPVIPGYPVRHDPSADRWTMDLRLSKPAGASFNVELAGLPGDTPTP